MALGLARAGAPVAVLARNAKATAHDVRHHRSQAPAARSRAARVSG
jgi:hypothetical protein